MKYLRKLSMLLVKAIKAKINFWFVQVDCSPTRRLPRKVFLRCFLYFCWFPKELFKKCPKALLPKSWNKLPQKILKHCKFILKSSWHPQKSRIKLFFNKFCDSWSPFIFFFFFFNWDSLYARLNSHWEVRSY